MASSESLTEPLILRKRRSLPNQVEPSITADGLTKILEKFTVEELRCYLKREKLPTSGRKVGEFFFNLKISKIFFKIDSTN